MRHYYLGVNGVGTSSDIPMYSLPPIAARINALFTDGRVKETAILCAQASLIVACHRDLLMFLKCSESTLSKLIAIGARCLICWSPSLIAKLPDQLELLYECTAHDPSVLEDAVQKGEIPGKKQKAAIDYLSDNGNRSQVTRQVCRRQTLSELSRRFACQAAPATNPTTERGPTWQDSCR